MATTRTRWSMATTRHDFLPTLRQTASVPSAEAEEVPPKARPRPRARPVFTGTGRDLDHGSALTPSWRALFRCTSTHLHPGCGGGHRPLRPGGAIWQHSLFIDPRRSRARDACRADSSTRSLITYSAPPPALRPPEVQLSGGGRHIATPTGHSMGERLLCAGITLFSPASSGNLGTTPPERR